MSELNSERLTQYFAAEDAGSNYEIMVDNVRALGHASVDCRTCRGAGYVELSDEALSTWYELLAEQKTDEHRRQVRAALSRASDCKSCKGSGKVSARRSLANCGACEGAGHDLEGAPCRECAGSGKDTDRSAAMDSMFTTVGCGRCKGCGEATPPTDTSAERQDVCLGGCRGDGYIVPVTVRCRGSSNQGGAGGSYVGDGDGAPLLLSAATPEPATDHREEHEERLLVAAELQRLQVTDPQLAAALASFHGPEAEPWVEHRWGRGFVLWQHTPAGKLIADNVAARSPARSGYLVAPTERIAEARAAVERPASGRPSPSAAIERQLVLRADREASELRRRVEAFTNEAKAA